jgi:hypothetical protein
VFSSQVPPTPSFFSIGHAGADDQHPEAGRRRRHRWLDIPADQAEFLRQQRPVLGGHLLVQGRGQHPGHPVRTGVDHGEPAAPVVQDRVEHRRADLLLDLDRQATGVVVPQALGPARPIGFGEPAVVTGQVREHQQQGGDVGFRQRGAQPVDLVRLGRLRGIHGGDAG